RRVRSTRESSSATWPRSRRRPAAGDRDSPGVGGEGRAPEARRLGGKGTGLAAKDTRGARAASGKGTPLEATAKKPGGADGSSPHPPPSAPASPPGPGGTSGRRGAADPIVSALATN